MMELTKGDVLIIKKEPYPLADHCVNYILVYDRKYRPYAANYALRFGKTKLEYDRDWNMTEFQDKHIIMRLDEATTVHNNFVSKLEDSIFLSGEAIELNGAPDVVVDPDGSLIEALKRKVYGQWVLAFLQNEYQKYRDTYIEHED